MVGVTVLKVAFECAWVWCLLVNIESEYVTRSMHREEVHLDFETLEKLTATSQVRNLGNG